MDRGQVKKASGLDPILQPGSGPRSLRELAFPRPLTILVPAPHPDDFDAIGLSLRHLHAQGHVVHLAVLTTGASGVEDGFSGTKDDAAKASLREAEQRESCAFFGLPPERLQFLRLWSDATQAETDFARLEQWMLARPADLVFMPHGDDSNATHRRTYETVGAIAARHGLQAWACLNEDAKTLQIRMDLFFEFGEEEAAWKAQLLRLHKSQHERNLRTRGTGFDGRVLEVNRRAAVTLGSPFPYAEAFELMRLGRPA
jgi:LmbE family N-acetylglucosaminyl deacetylase